MFVLEGFSDEESESSIEVVDGHEVVLKTSSEKTTSDDPDYLQLLEAHQQRLEDAASGMFMCCCFFASLSRESYR